MRTGTKDILKSESLAVFESSILLSRQDEAHAYIAFAVSTFAVQIFICATGSCYRMYCLLPIRPTRLKPYPFLQQAN